MPRAGSQKRSPKTQSAQAAKSGYVLPKRSPEQQARATELLSSFRNFAMMWQGPQWYHAQPHDEMCDELEQCVPEIGVGNQQKKKLYLAPRYTYKTNLMIAFMAYVILLYLEDGIYAKIDYVRADASKAREVLYELKMGLQQKDEILELWGNLAESATIWTESRINISNLRDPTVSTSGIDAGAAGKHPDVVIFDDLVDDKNWGSIRARRSGKNKVQAYYPVLPPWGSMIVTGTRFAHDDVYGSLLEQNERDARQQRQLLDDGKFDEAKKFKPQWSEYIRSVRNAEGDLFFPAVLNDEFLEQQKRSIQPRFYAAWYLNSPDVEGMKRFRLEYLQYFTGHFAALPYPVLEIYGDTNGRRLKLDEFPVRTFLTIDPTVTASSTSDWTGMTLVATDAEDNWWVLLCRRYLLVPSEVGEEAAKIIRECRPEMVLIESANADVGMVARIQAVISDERIPTIIKSYHPLRDEKQRTGRRQKAARIEALEPRFRNGNIFLARGSCEALYDQYKAWPDLEHDDAIDSLAMHYGFAKKCTYRTVEEADLLQFDEDDDAMPGDFFRKGYETVVRTRDGESMLIGCIADDEEDERRLVGRTGLGAQRLRRLA